MPAVDVESSFIPDHYSVVRLTQHVQRLSQIHKHSKYCVCSNTVTPNCNTSLHAELQNRAQKVHHVDLENVHSLNIKTGVRFQSFYQINFKTLDICNCCMLHPNDEFLVC